MIEYRTGNELDLDAVIAVYRDSSLGVRRPIDDRARMARMLGEANLVISAWDGGEIVGLARSMSDFVFVTYVADLVVREACQRQGIGRELLRRTQAAAPQARLVLLAAPAAVDYYPRVGFSKHPQCWELPPGEPLR